MTGATMTGATTIGTIMKNMVTTATIIDRSGLM